MPSSREPTVCVYLNDNRMFQQCAFPFPSLHTLDACLIFLVCFIIYLLVHTYFNEDTLDIYIRSVGNVSRTFYLSRNITMTRGISKGRGS
jgi:hypothetical protein